VLTPGKQKPTCVGELDVQVYQRDCTEQHCWLPAHESSVQDKQSVDTAAARCPPQLCRGLLKTDTFIYTRPQVNIIMMPKQKNTQTAREHRNRFYMYTVINISLWHDKTITQKGKHSVQDANHTSPQINRSKAKIKEINTKNYKPRQDTNSRSNFTAIQVFRNKINRILTGVHCWTRLQSMNHYQQVTMQLLHLTLHGHDRHALAHTTQHSRYRHPTSIIRLHHYTCNRPNVKPIYPTNVTSKNIFL